MHISDWSSDVCSSDLPRILDGSDWWCQGYSEPGAGSDLASLKTSALRDGDHYIVNGQKPWTTLGQYANMIFCLVRTRSEERRVRKEWVSTGRSRWSP